MAGDPWAALSEEEALFRVRKSIHPRWEAWTCTNTVPGGDRITVWCARRRSDSALVHADSPGQLLQHLAYADEDLFYERQHDNAHGH